MTDATQHRITGSATVVRMKASLAGLHMNSASQCCSRCIAIESNVDLALADHSLIDENFACAATSVIMSVAALEASINELFLAAADGNAAWFPSAPAHALPLLAELWNGIERLPLLDKHQVALVAASKPRLSTGAQPFQAAQAVVQLRNLLLHFQPEWDNELEAHQRLEKKARGMFAENKISLAQAAGSKALWFPHLCLGAGCASWALKSIGEFHRTFAFRLGSVPVLEWMPTGRGDLRLPDIVDQ